MMKLHCIHSIVLALLLGVPNECEAFSASTSSITTSSSGKESIFHPAVANFDYMNNDKLPWINEHYGTWKWQDKHNINYIEMGDPSKPALLLIHGFGASAYHFRYNIPILARDYHVYAFDKIGFGLSDKPIDIGYTAELWKDQTIDFIKDVIGKPTTLAGNSIGGYTALYASSSNELKEQSLVNGCILLNGAGRFKDPNEEVVTTVDEPNMFVEKIKEVIQRLVISASFIYTKQPARIEQVLKQVYPINSNNVDPELIESIQTPATDPNAAEVFYRVITKNGNNGSNGDSAQKRKQYQQRSIDELLDGLDCPLLLCWGEEDPWIRPMTADKIQQLYPSKSKRVSINAGHCPHDEAPQEVNAAINDFMKEIASK